MELWALVADKEQEYVVDSAVGRSAKGQSRRDGKVRRVRVRDDMLWCGVKATSQKYLDGGLEVSPNWPIRHKQPCRASR